MARADLRTLIVASMAGASMLGLKPVYGQDSTSREVRQALPSEEVEQLRTALQQLARNPQSVSALVEAGDASLAVGDYSLSWRCKCSPKPNRRAPP